MTTRRLARRAHFPVAAMLLLALAMTGSASAQVSLPLRGESGEMILGLGTLEAAVYSPDGKHIATAGSLGAFLWDAETGALLRTFLGHTGRVYSVAFSPDGKRVLTGSGDKSAKLWDAETGQEIRTFRHTLGVHSVAFSSDGSRVLTASAGSWGSEGTVTLWDAETGQEIRTFGYGGGTLVAFSSDGKRVLTVSGGSAWLWDAESGRVIDTFPGTQPPAAISPDGRWVLTSSGDETVRIWDISDLAATSGVSSEEWTVY